MTTCTVARARAAGQPASKPVLAQTPHGRLIVLSRCGLLALLTSESLLRVLSKHWMTPFALPGCTIFADASTVCIREVSR
jgi:hypothetical protein